MFSFTYLVGQHCQNAAVQQTDGPQRAILTKHQEDVIAGEEQADNSGLLPMRVLHYRLLPPIPVQKALWMIACS